MRSQSVLLKKWPNPIVESKGNYKDELYLEKHLGGQLYSHQKDLPRLPIPSVSETLPKVLSTSLPLAECKEESELLKKHVDDFPTQATELQRLLEERRENNIDNSSWLQHWWNTLMYLDYRESVVINVSYFFHFADDMTMTAMQNTTKNSSTNHLGIRRAAAVLNGVANFRGKVCSGTLKPETVGKAATKICSTMYKYMFHACRIPQLQQDTYRIYDPSLHKHCVVAYKGQFFAVDFINPSTGEALPLSLIEKRLQRCVQLADKNLSDNNVPPSLGWCTGCNRDNWAKARQALLDLNTPSIDKALEMLESGAVLICLDDEEAVSRNQCGALFLHGNTTSTYNRWFDKSIQLIFTKNGKMGLCGEHSMMDGMPVVNFSNYIGNVRYADILEMSAPSYDEDIDSGVKDIFGDCCDALNNSSDVHSAVENAKIEVTKSIEDHELNSIAFHGYGANYIKSCGFSPDAYMQMALQLATYRLFQKQAATYEATQVRTFLHGRTETTRTVSPASHAFCVEMGLSPKSLDEMLDNDKRKLKLNLLQKAVKSHVNYISKAAQGFGVDRHLLGLSLVDEQNKYTKPDLFKDPLYNRAKTWRVSTSHLTSPIFMNWGYGEVDRKGVGLSYMIKPDSCAFNVTARKEHDYVEGLGYFLEEALLEMKTLNDLEKGFTSKL